MALSDLKCCNARPSEKTTQPSDGEGIQLWVQPTRLAYAHGFRATASSLPNESGQWHPDAIELQLAHIENNDVRRAFARGTYW
jgi:hypothetical protein